MLMPSDDAFTIQVRPMMRRSVCLRTSRVILRSLHISLDDLMRGYYGGENVHPFDERYPINQWDKYD